MTNFKTPAPAPSQEPTLFPTYDQLVQENENLRRQIEKLKEELAITKSLYNEECVANDKLRRENAVLEE
jgi:hypothetical protein